MVVPSDYFVSTQLQLWLFCCWAVTISWKVLFWTGSGRVGSGRGGTGRGRTENKTNSAQLELGLGLSLAKILEYNFVNFRLQTPNMMTLFLRESLKPLWFGLDSLKPFVMISIFHVLFGSTIHCKDLLAACTCGTAV